MIFHVLLPEYFSYQGWTSLRVWCGGLQGRQWVGTITAFFDLAGV